ncbi:MULTISPECIES: IS3 family transposase [unclassified Lysinibacillus]|uniref:IS3 family transposase n=1 Tax=unclassified Lysinibacillus TaxID=2636778 RepID=UPI00382979C8
MAVQALHHNDNLSISLLCEFAGIARSAYYKWTQRTPTKKQQENEEIVKEINNLYENAEGNYGYRKMTLHLNEKFNKQYNHKRVYRLMKLASLKSEWSKKNEDYLKSPN